MKKAKTLLLIITVVTSVGATLAFKVQKFGSDKYCYIETPTQPAASDCIKTISRANAVPFTTGTKLYYTSTTDLTNCGSIACPNVGELPWEG